MWLNLYRVISVLEGVRSDWIALLTGRLWPEKRERHYQKLFIKRKRDQRDFLELATGVVMGG